MNSLSTGTRTPTARKLQLAALLRHLREREGITQRDAGGAVWPRSSAGSVQNKIARLESGDTGIEAEDLHKLLAVYGVVDGELADLARELQADTSQRGRWSGFRSIYSEQYRRYIDLEEDALLIRHVATEQVPELLQCRSYMEAEFAAVREGSPALAPPAIEARFARQEQVLFRDEPPQVHAVLSESCLRRVQGNKAVMREQLEHLISLSKKRPNIQLQVVPFAPRPLRTTAIQETGILERFALLRLAAPTLPGLEPGHLDFAFTRTGNELSRSDDVRHYETLWRRATTAALPVTESRLFLREVLYSFG
ncbi:transcriptional regulator with XRE-family HTH domain [Amycolatopsis bartoniae]|uniref:Transcriptional regulator n=1 Tax=Amycolatopsis bartoniae TaxID=941986 RepID=A0A8H9IXH9_9PSEU|nr:helix-turn-helix transcriptional regulator [Amycolatopsis bartoniae]MBB2938996.1 transcriptional regulator with XRE-family HTH domain [Amycolatopsis bartoniae]GHF65694.1 transcriptional regulator [Amycolatopsis bartoniae]